MQAAGAFAAACTAVCIYAPEDIIKPLMELKDLTFKFDEYAAENRDRKRWTKSQEADYELSRVNAESAMLPFIAAARKSIMKVLDGVVS